jgi:N-acetylmuramic acid 6-phosphate (MurNAc-6-P) etherase
MFLGGYTLVGKFNYQKNNRRYKKQMSIKDLKNKQIVQEFANCDKETYQIIEKTNPSLKLMIDVCSEIVNNR